MMKRDGAPPAMGPVEAQPDTPSGDAVVLTDAAAEAAAGGMCVNHSAFLKWATTHDEKGNEIDPQTGQIVKASGR